MLWSFCKHFRIYSSSCEEPTDQFVFRKNIPKNIATKPPMMFSLASWTATTSKGMLMGKKKFKKPLMKKLLIAESPDEKACATDERVDPFKLWPEVAREQHP